jgi:UDPglucose 6-dehydrogenase
LGFAYKKDTGDTRESAAIGIVTNLVDEGAKIAIYDPRVKEEQIWRDLHCATDDTDVTDSCVSIHTDVYSACADAHAIVILTEWDEFSNKLPKAIPSIQEDYNKTAVVKAGSGTSPQKPQMDWARVAKHMLRPMFVFDGRNVVDGPALEGLGFRVECIGKASASSGLSGGSLSERSGSPRLSF